MKLEETVQIRLYVVEESAYREVPDLYTCTTTDWHDEDPVYFTSKGVADRYKEFRTNKLTKAGYVEFDSGMFYSKHDDCQMRNISVSHRKASKERIIEVKNEPYFFNKKNNKMHKIHETQLEDNSKTN